MKRCKPWRALALEYIMHLYFPYEAIISQGAQCIDPKGYTR